MSIFSKCDYFNILILKNTYIFIYLKWGYMIGVYHKSQVLHIGPDLDAKKIILKYWWANPLKIYIPLFEDVWKPICSHNSSLTIKKPPFCTPINWGVSYSTKNVVGGAMVCWDLIVTNKLDGFINNAACAIEHIL